jgi:hypothetical protein
MRREATLSSAVRPMSTSAPSSNKTDPDMIEPGDASTIGAVLAEFQSAAQIDTLAGALDWTLERTLLALEVERTVSSRV